MNVSNGSSLIQLKKSIENFLLQLKNQRSGSKTVCGFTSISILKGIMMLLKSKTPCNLLNENINFTKNGTESKMENLIHSFVVLQFI